MKKLSSIFFASLVFTLAAGSLTAQQTVSASKRALIKELNEVTGAKESTDQMFDTMLALQETDSAKMLESLVNNDQTMTAEQKNEVLQKSKESSARLMKKFREYFTTELNLSAAIDDISYMLYDKYFTDDELKDLIAFYRSPTGKKAMAVMPKLFADTMSMFSDKYMPKMLEFVKKTVDAEMTELKKELEPPAPKPKN